MRRGLVAFSALTLIGLGVTGCGLFRFEQREPWRAQAEEACLSQRLVQPSAYMSRASAIDGPGACGISYPFKVTALAGGSVGLSSRGTLACPIIPNIDAWLNEVVQPAASLYFGAAVAEVKSGSYSCRPRNNRSGAKLSEHAFGNALDVMGFRFADGREITVLQGWRGTPVEQEFLREVFVAACSYFTTVLGPGADAHHDNHFHLDLARHDPRGQRRVCKPVLKFAPRLDGGALLARRPQPDAGRPYEQPEIDVEDDHDPYAVAALPRTKPSSAARPSAPVWARAPASMDGRHGSREQLPPVVSMPPSRSDGRGRAFAAAPFVALAACLAAALAGTLASGAGAARLRADPALRAAARGAERPDRPSAGPRARGNRFIEDTPAENRSARSTASLDRPLGRSHGRGVPSGSEMPMRLALLVTSCALALASASFARELTPAEKRVFPYDAQIPACHDVAVLEKIASYFAEKETKFWQSNLRIAEYEQIRPVAWRPWGLDYIPRRFCTGRVVTSDGHAAQDRLFGAGGSRRDRRELGRRMVRARARPQLGL